MIIIWNNNKNLKGGDFRLIEGLAYWLIDLIELININ